MGNSSYNLHKACPEQNAKYQRCYKLFFENRLYTQPSPIVAADPNDAVQVAAAQEANRRQHIIYEDGEVITKQEDVDLAIDSLQQGGMNYACRDLWEDYRECVTEVWRQKDEEYLRKKTGGATGAALATPASAVQSTAAPQMPVANSAPKP